MTTATYETLRLKTARALLASVGAALAGVIAASITGLALLTTIPQARSMNWGAPNGVPPAIATVPDARSKE